MQRRGVIYGGLALIAALVAIWLARRSGDDDVSAETRTDSRAAKTAQRDSSVPKVDFANGRRIAGVVVGSDGGTLAGARVTLTALRPPPAAKDEIETSDAAGAFDFGSRPLGLYAIAAIKAGLTPEAMILDTRDLKETPETLRLVIRACDAKIYGVIRDNAGGVIAGASVGFATRWARSVANIDSATDGTYELCVPRGESEIQVTADGYVIAYGSVRTSGRMRRDVVLFPGATVTGRVVRATDKTAVANASIEIEDEAVSGHRVPVATTSADGSFAIEGVRPGKYRVSATADGLATESPAAILVEMDATPEVTVELVAAMSIAGRIVETGTGAPVPDTLISSAMETPRGMQRYRGALSSADGSFVLEHLLPGTYKVRLGDYADVKERDVVIEKHDVNDVVFEVEPRGSVAGTVTHEGQPVEGAAVSLGGLDITLTNANGEFELERVREGTHRIRAESDRLGAFTDRAVVTIAKAEHRTGVRIDLDMHASIAGTVLDQDGAPVEGARVRFSLESGDAGDSSTGDNGAFEVRALKGGGDYKCEIYTGRDPRNDVGRAMSPANGAQFPRVPVADAKTHVAGQVIRVRVDRLEIAGRIVDSAGMPVADATVTATHQRNASIEARATSDRHGAFTVRALGPGLYKVHVDSTRGEVEETKVAVGRSDLVLRVSGFGSLEGTLEGFTEPVGVHAVGPPSRSGEVEVTGLTFRAASLPAGSYIVYAFGPNGEGQATVIVREGAKETVAIKRRSTGIIEGTLVDQTTKQPLANAHCSSGNYWGPSNQSGKFRIDRAVTGQNGVECRVGGKAVAAGDVTVVADQVARISLLARETKDWTVGMTYTLRDDEVAVLATTQGGPAEKAGVRIGDKILKVRGVPINGRRYTIDDLVVEWFPENGPLKFELERDGRPLALMVTPVERD